MVGNSAVLTPPAPQISYTRSCCNNFVSCAQSSSCYSNRQMAYHSCGAAQKSCQSSWSRIPVRNGHRIVCGFTNRKRMTKYHKKNYPKMTILGCYNRLVETGCVSHREQVQSRTCVADETTENVRQTFVVRSSRKSTKRASLELNIPKTTAWKIMKKRMCCKPYQLTTGTSFERW